jgi:hypothetical protein
MFNEGQEIIAILQGIMRRIPDYAVTRFFAPHTIRLSTQRFIMHQQRRLFTLHLWAYLARNIFAVFVNDRSTTSSAH